MLRSRCLKSRRLGGLLAVAAAVGEGLPAAPQAAASLTQITNFGTNPTGLQRNVNSNGTITGAQSGLCLDMTGASTANGALVELWSCNGGSNQQWTLR